MLNLNQHNVSVLNLNTRIQKHGKERKLAIDLKFSVTGGGQLCDDVEPGLRNSLFRTIRKDDQLSLVDNSKNNDDALVIVRHPLLEPQRLNQKFTGYELAVGVVEDEEFTELLFLVGVELKGFTVKAIEGGSAEITFTAANECECSDGNALLDILERGDVVMNLVPPAKQAEGETDSDQELHDAA